MKWNWWYNKKINFNKNNDAYIISTNTNNSHDLQNSWEVSLMLWWDEQEYVTSYIMSFDKNTQQRTSLWSWFEWEIYDIVFNNIWNPYIIKNRIELASNILPQTQDQWDLELMWDLSDPIELELSSIQEYDSTSNTWQTLDIWFEGDIQYLMFDSDNNPYIMWYDFDSNKLKASKFDTSENMETTYQRFKDDEIIPWATSKEYSISSSDEWSVISFEVTFDGLDWTDLFSIRSSWILIPISNTENLDSPRISGGWGGWSTIQRDTCPENRDCSDSYYDSLCGPCDLEEYQEQKEHGSPEIEYLIQNKQLFNQEVARVKASNNKWYSNELVESYVFAKDLWVTTKNTIEQANLEWTLIRSHMAKMISNFAIKTLQSTINTWRNCNFSDMKNQSQEMRTYAQLVCQLWLMGLEWDGTTPKNNFDPNGIVTRAQFGTVMSRLLYWSQYNIKPWENLVWYYKHLNTLKQENIMTKIENPSMQELRWWTMLMMMRIFEKQE